MFHPIPNSGGVPVLNIVDLSFSANDKDNKKYDSK